jgi:hypothetical protein
MSHLSPALGRFQPSHAQLRPELVRNRIHHLGYKSEALEPHEEVTEIGDRSHVITVLTTAE